MATVTTTVLADQVVAAYDRNAMFQLRAGSVFDQFAKVKPGNVTSPGESVDFLFWDEMSPATTPIAEATDITPVALGDSLVQITPDEYGNAVNVSIRVRKDTFALGFDGDVANLVGYNMLDTQETLAEAALSLSGTEVTVAASVGATVAADVLTMGFVAQQVAALRAASVVPNMGNNYSVVVHPHVAYDLMDDTGNHTWRDLKHTESAPLKAGVLGSFAGATFLESPRALIEADAGSGNVDIYTSYIQGQEAFGKVETIPLHIVPGPVTDFLKRFMPLGWHGYFGYGEIRNEALLRALSASSLGANT